MVALTRLGFLIASDRENQEKRYSMGEKYIQFAAFNDAPSFTSWLLFYHRSSW
jgi:hypothetical protein